MLYTGAPAILDLEYDKIRVSVEGDRLRWRRSGTDTRTHQKTDDENRKYTVLF